MKILIITTNSDLSGAPLHVLDLSKGLYSRGIIPIVILGAEGAVQKELERCGIKTYVVEMHSDYNIFRDLKTIKSLVDIVRFESPDIVHCHSTKAGMVGRIAAKLTKVPSVYTIHGWGFGEGRPLLKSLFIFVVEKLLSKITTKYIAVSNYDRAYGIKTLRISEDSIYTIHNGRDCELDTIKTRREYSERMRCVMVARNDPQKDFATLARAISQVDSCIFTLVGRGTDNEEFRKSFLIKANQSGNDIRFLGVRKDVSSILQASDVFILASNFEGLPLSIIEAMSVGLPIIASNVGGVSELVKHGINGFLVERGDSSAMASFISLFANNSSLRIAAGIRSREIYLKGFTARTFVKNTLMLYKELLNK